MVSELQRTCGKGLFELPDNINYPHGGIQNTMQWCCNVKIVNVMEGSVEGHNTWNDSHVETWNKKLSFQTFYGAMI